MANARRSPQINVMVDAAEKAGRVLLRDFNEVEHLQVSRKGPGDFVSAADHRSEKTVIMLLQKARPDFGILAEESGETKGKDNNTRWIIDPLDGTTNFLHGIPHWCVSIALERNKEIVSAVVYDPVRDEMFWAEKGTGAYVNNRRLRISSRKTMADALINIGDATKGAPLTAGDEGCAVRMLGSACLDLCYVAAGRADGYLERGPKAWDFAAGSLIAQEAGAKITDMQGGPDFIYGGSILASTPDLHPALLKIAKMTATPKTKAAS